MISLGAGSDLVKTCKELKPEDLTSQTALIHRSFATGSEKQNSALVLDHRHS